MTEKGKGWHGDKKGHREAANSRKYKRVFKTASRTPFVDKNREAKQIWADLGDIPVDDNGNIQEPFMQFSEGTDREDIWHWIEATFNVPVHDLMFNKDKDDPREHLNLKDFKTTFDPVPGTISAFRTGTGYTAKYISVDNDPQSPREDDNLGTMVCFHKRYDLGDKTNYNRKYFNSWKELEDKIRADNNNKIVAIYPIYMYDHGGVTIKTTPFGDHFDSGQIGFIYVSEAKIRDEWSLLKNEPIPDDIRVKASQNLLGEVESYDQYLTGDVYTIVKETYDKHKNQVDYDTVGGFFGQKYAEEALKTDI